MENLKKVAFSLIVLLLVVVSLTLAGTFLLSPSVEAAAPLEQETSVKLIFSDTDVVSGTAVFGSEVLALDLNRADVYYHLINSAGTTVTITLQGNNNLTKEWADTIVLYSGADAEAVVITNTVLYGSYTRMKIEADAGPVTVDSNGRFYWE